MIVQFYAERGQRGTKKSFRTLSSKNKISFASVARCQQRIAVYPETSWNQQVYSQTLELTLQPPTLEPDVTTYVSMQAWLYNACFYCVRATTMYLSFSIVWFLASATYKRQSTPKYILGLSSCFLSSFQRTRGDTMVKLKAVSLHESLTCQGKYNIAKYHRPGISQGTGLTICT